MKKKKLYKKLKEIERRIDKLENSEHAIRTIGFDYLNNPHDDNEYEDEGY